MFYKYLYYNKIKYETLKYFISKSIDSSLGKVYPVSHLAITLLLIFKSSARSYCEIHLSLLNSFNLALNNIIPQHYYILKIIIMMVFY